MTNDLRRHVITGRSYLSTRQALQRDPTNCQVDRLAGEDVIKRLDRCVQPEVVSSGDGLCSEPSLRRRRYLGEVGGGQDVAPVELISLVVEDRLRFSVQI